MLWVGGNNPHFWFFIFSCSVPSRPTVQVPVSYPTRHYGTRTNTCLVYLHGKTLPCKQHRSYKCQAVATASGFLFTHVYHEISIRRIFSQFHQLQLGGFQQYTVTAAHCLKRSEVVDGLAIFSTNHHKWHGNPKLLIFYQCPWFTFHNTCISTYSNLSN